MYQDARYDILGRVTRTVAPDGSATSVVHTGLRTVTTNAKGQKRTEVANALGEMVTSTDNLGGIVEYEYDARGNVVRVTSRKPSSDTDASVPARIESSMGYDALDRKLWSMSPEAGRTSYRYNGFGEVVRRENGNGHHTVTAYDGLGRTRIRSDRRSDGTVESNAAWEYDTGATALGMLVGESDSVSGFLRRHHHDSLGRRSETETRPGTGADITFAWVSSAFTYVSSVSSLYRIDGYRLSRDFQSYYDLTSERNLRDYATQIHP